MSAAAAIDAKPLSDGPEQTGLGPGVIFLSGPHLSGKGTLARALMEQYQIPAGNNISIGSTLRAIRDQVASDPDAVERERGISRTKLISVAVEPELQHFAEMQHVDVSAMTEQDWFRFCIDKGGLLPTAWLLPIFTDHLNKIEDRTKPVMLDGVPRRLEEAKAVFALLAEINIPILHLFEFVFREGDQTYTEQEHLDNIQTLIARSGNRDREDDMPESIANRYALYLDTIVPTLNWMHDMIDSPAHITQLPMSFSKDQTRDRAFKALDGLTPIPIRREKIPSAANAIEPEPVLA